MRFFVLLFLLTISFCGSAQNFGGNPASVRWRQINTDTVRIIFPQGSEHRAQRIANIVHLLQQRYAHTIGDTLHKFSILVQDRSLVSNGYVSLGPYRSEFYTTPPQDAFSLGAQSWTDNLSVHEFRHIQQYSNFNKGLSKLAHVLLGQQGQLVANAAAIPDWFFEGDAVFNETKLTPQGRGSLPLFLSHYQSLALAHKQYPYMKLRNGSLRDYVPDHYDLGYLLVAYGRKQYGDYIWRSVTNDAARFRPLFYPFQGAVKKNMGVPFSQFVNDAMEYYREQWTPASIETPQWVTFVQPHVVNNYQFPYATEDGSVIVVKTSLARTPAFYRVDANGREEKIAAKDISADNYFSYNNGRIVYAAYQPDARWGNRDFRRIKVVDTRTGEETTIASRTTFFSPDISHDGNQVIAVEILAQGGSRMVVTDRNGVVTDSLPASAIVFSHPKFSEDDKHFYTAARNPAGQMSLVKYTMHDNRPGEILVPLSNRIIGFLSVQRDTVLFTTTYNGRDELWAVIDGKERRGPFRLASYPTGIYQGVIGSDGALTGSVFTANGYRLAKFQPLWQRVEIKDDLHDLYVGDVYRQPDHFVLDSLSPRNFGVTKYSKLHNLLNIHSYRPYYQPPEYSFTLYGENVLNTLQSEIAYTYNENESSHSLSYNGIYGGTYIQPLFGISQTWNRTARLNKDTSVHWNELTAYAGLQLPLNLSGGKQYRYLTLSSTYNIDHVYWTGIGEKFFRNTDFGYLQSRISFSGQNQQAAQQIYPHLAEALFLQYRNSTNQFTAHQLLASGSLYLPGLANSHSIVLSAAVHSRDTLLQYLFSNNFPFSRGYSGLDFPDMWKWGMNYHLPLAYPDWGFGQLVYFLRVRANLFYDHTVGHSRRTGADFTFRSTGAEVFFDTRWWNQQPVTFGVRYNRLLDNPLGNENRPDVWEIVLPVSLF